MMTTDDSLPVYGTTGEKAFLDQLASSPKAHLLLSNYINAAEKRTVWTGINKTEVLLYAELLLGNAQAADHSAQRVVRAA